MGNINDILQKIEENNQEISLLTKEKNKITKKVEDILNSKIISAFFFICMTVSLLGLVSSLFGPTIQSLQLAFTIIFYYLVEGSIKTYERNKCKKISDKILELEEENATLEKEKTKEKDFTKLNEDKPLEETKQESQFEQVENIEYETPVKEEKGRQYTKKRGVTNGRQCK